MVELRVEFAEHMAESRIASLVTGIAAFGSVTPTGVPRTYSVAISRTSELSQLEEQLVKWERHGFIRWQAAA
jgi:hypothetical protein